MWNGHDLKINSNRNIFVWQIERIINSNLIRSIKNLILNVCISKLEYKSNESKLIIGVNKLHRNDEEFEYDICLVCGKPID